MNSSCIIDKFSGNINNSKSITSLPWVEMLNLECDHCDKNNDDDDGGCNGDR